MQDTLIYYNENANVFVESMVLWHGLVPCIVYSKMPCMYRLAILPAGIILWEI